MEKNEVQGNRENHYGNNDEVIPRVFVLSDIDPMFKEDDKEGMCEDLRLLKDLLSTNQSRQNPIKRS